MNWLQQLTFRQIFHAATGIWLIKIIAFWIIDVLKGK